ncbi:UDP-N-acetylmuramoyl-L-alanyl-D-glutamate--2,6-diaminopimelate ligase [Humisphaera borealis]|uniref:UDP-N-acetylmuramoyl-L-alanyl-D-glutamate--2,6-diaminopimelate ligase n=1 Tax=Humisphaera borealis TaxID=2807512 RepID=A0A7M2WUY1_9BACT|nr:UDP-N-acetylmuramoyl-L-alanyl-D-glutamate--2,6-diaminopimelate ligase [Humisphaera borealis]QOV89012.1 UDP-N-acetylmuramoyl-L-alanyl-D-glutamate--2,6-diaminopimelate ligase [Humisphaera borealis]
MLLFDLLRSASLPVDLDRVPNVPINAVREDSRLVRPGDLFVARPGGKTDGAKFLEDARSRGAVAAVVASRVESPLPQVIARDIRPAASKLAMTLLGRPDRAVKVIGVTGTNGKTTTTYLLRHLLGRIGLKCGLVGTVEVDDGKSVREASMTTPSACDIADHLAAMRDNGCGFCAMEISSHALDQGRAAGVNFAGGVFTNLTGDHLDYHKTMDAYADAKASLFNSLGENAVAVVNAASPWSDRMVRDAKACVVRFGLTEDCDYAALMPATTAGGTKFMLKTPDGTAEMSLLLIGRHNIENALGAAAIAGETCGLSVHQIAAGLKNAIGAPGRLQPVRAGQPFACFVDYAHTDDGLDNVLRAARPVTKKKLRVLFGCGGDRDRTKRPRMAATAERLADAVYITSDNPRTEDPLAIIDEVVAGLSPAARDRAVVEPDRREAIRRIIADAEPGDVVVIAGKGHENYQIIGTEKRHFDDVEEATAAIRGVLA